MTDIAGGVCVVTGAASGIGRASAIAFAGAGADVVVSDVNREGSDEVVARIKDMGRDAVSIPADVSDRAQVEALVDASIDWKGRCDVFMSNAGVGIGGAVEHIPLEDWSWAMDINLWSHIWAVRRLLPHMFGRGSGHLVHTASSAGTFGVATLAPYAVTKFAVVGLCESLAVYCRPKGVNVSVVCPLIVNTSIMEGARMTPEPGTESDAEAQQELIKKVFAEVGIPPEKVADDIVDAVAADRLYVFPHPELRQILEGKLADPDAWVTNSANFTPI